MLFMLTSPGFRQQSLGFRQQSPGFRQQSPGFRQQSPGFRQQSPGFRQQSPGFRHQSPGFLFSVDLEFPDLPVTKLEDLDGVRSFRLISICLIPFCLSIKMDTCPISAISSSFDCSVGY